MSKVKITRRYQYYFDNGEYPSQDVLDRHGSFSTLAQAIANAKAFVGKQRVAVAGATMNRGSGNFFRRSRVVQWDSFSHRFVARKWGR